MGPAGDMESHNRRVTRESIELQSMLAARRLPRRAWQLWKTLGGVDRTALKEFFETDGHYVRLRKYFFSLRRTNSSGGEGTGFLRLPRPAWKLWKNLRGAHPTALQDSSRTMTISFISATISSVDPLRL